MFYISVDRRISLLIILLIFRERFLCKCTGKIVLNVLAATYILFYVLWGFNYFREGLYQRLNLTKHEPDNKAFVKQLKKIVDETNKSWCTFETWDKEQS
ncbi:MAG: DUF3810 domain-containing protein [Marinilabiliales bacterium]|nr:DUF3810 domain-containing protein [Marinilabiliales bacterium]